MIYKCKKCQIEYSTIDNTVMDLVFHYKNAHNRLLLPSQAIREFITVGKKASESVLGYWINQK